MRRKKLGRNMGHRRAMLRNLVTSFLAEEHITTTEPRAMSVQPLAERMITLAKQGGLAARRRALAYLYDEDVVRKLFDTLGPRYKDRTGGYTRIVRLGVRQGDSAPMVMLELV